MGIFNSTEKSIVSYSEIAEACRKCDVCSVLKQSLNYSLYPCLLQELKVQIKRWAVNRYCSSSDHADSEVGMQLSPSSENF